MGARRSGRATGSLLVAGSACLAGGFGLMVLGLNDVQPLVTFGRDPEPDVVTRGRALLWGAAGLHVLAAAAFSARERTPWVLGLIAAPGTTTALLAYVETRSALAWAGLLLVGPLAVLAAARAASSSSP